MTPIQIRAAKVKIDEQILNKQARMAALREETAKLRKRKSELVATKPVVAKKKAKAK